MEKLSFELFQKANAAFYLDKYQYWFPLKQKLLSLYGCYDGYDAQLFTYGSRHLKRYLLNDKVFHVPGKLPFNEFDSVKNTIYGSIKHDDVSSVEGVKAMLVLMNVYDPHGFEKILEADSVPVDVYVTYHNEINTLAGQIKINNNPTPKTLNSTVTLSNKNNEKYSQLTAKTA